MNLFSILSLYSIVFVLNSPVFVSSMATIAKNGVILDSGDIDSPQNSTSSDKQLALAAINDERQAVGVPPMEWSDVLEANAQAYVDSITKDGNCTIQHADRDKRIDQGESIYQVIDATINQTLILEAIKAFNEEKPCYKSGLGKNGYLNKDCNGTEYSDGLVTQYSQNVWKGTKFVGCAQASTGNCAQVVCRYFPPGNHGGADPFGDDPSAGSVAATKTDKPQPDSTSGQGSPQSDGQGSDGQGQGSQGSGNSDEGNGDVDPVPIKYKFGSRVMTDDINVYNIYYGDFSSDEKNLLESFIKGLGDTDYWNLTRQYYFQQDENSPKKYVSGKLSLAGTYDSPLTNGSTVNDIGPVVQQAIDDKQFKVDPNGVYQVLLGKGISNDGFCKQYCGFHTSHEISQGIHVPIIFVGYTDTCCNSRDKTPNGLRAADGMIPILAHELIESVTDPNADFAWGDDKSNEVMDKCAWKFGKTQADANGADYNLQVGGKNFLTQQIFDPVTQRCQMRP